MRDQNRTGDLYLHGWQNVFSDPNELVANALVLQTSAIKAASGFHSASSLQLKLVAYLKATAAVSTSLMPKQELRSSQFRLFVIMSLSGRQHHAWSDWVLPDRIGIQFVDICRKY